MPEVSDNAAIFIGTSFQAHERANKGDELTMTCNCTISLLFAGFYLEENLNVIIEKMNKAGEVTTFVEAKRPSLFLKLAWFYFHYVDKDLPLNNKQHLETSNGKKKLILETLEKRFPGFIRINSFRNEIAHGKIEHSVTFAEEDILRQNVKDIV